MVYDTDWINEHRRELDHCHRIDLEIAIKEVLSKYVDMKITDELKLAITKAIEGVLLEFQEISYNVTCT